MSQFIVVKYKNADAVVISSSIVSITECSIDNTRFITTVDAECIKTTTTLKDIINQLKGQ